MSLNSFTIIVKTLGGCGQSEIEGDEQEHLRPVAKS